jgi:hypothetical protein
MALIKIKGVKAYVSNGKTYAYHRKTGTPLLKPFGSTEFLAERDRGWCQGTQGNA